MQSQRLTFGQTGSMLFRKAVYPAKNGVSRMESHSLHWVTGSENSSQKPLRQKVLPVFAKLPSEHELHFSTAGTGTPPVMICLPENIRIEVAADCPARLLTALLQALKNYA